MMTHFRFVHAADLHLDTPFEGIGRVSPVVAETLRDASLDAWDALVELTIAREASFLLLAGDIYDGAERGVRAQLRFRRGLAKLSERGIPAFIVHGNHDPLEGWSAIRSWPEGVTIFGSGQVEPVPVADGLVMVHGVSFARRDTVENLALRLARGPEAAFHIGLLHCNLGADEAHPAYSACTVEDLRRVGLDYWALGHIHRRQVVRDGNPWIVYPGNLQGRSPKPSELGPKGAMVVEVEGRHVRQVEFQPVDRVRFIDLDLDISAMADLPALQAELIRQADARREENAGRGLLVRASLSGRGPLHQDLGRPGAADDLVRDIRQVFEGQTPFLWWVDLADHTRASLDLDRIRGRGDFSAELLRLAGELAADPARLAARAQMDREELAGARLPPEVLEGGAGEGGGGPPGRGRDASSDSLARAVELALDLLEGDRS